MTRIHERALTLLAGQDVPRKHNRNKQMERHMFCSVCGVYFFHPRRAMPVHYAVNLHCFDILESSGIGVCAAQGKTVTVKAEGALAFWRGLRVS